MVRLFDDEVCFVCMYVCMYVCLYVCLFVCFQGSLFMYFYFSHESFTNERSVCGTLHKIHIEDRTSTAVTSRNIHPIIMQNN